MTTNMSSILDMPSGSARFPKLPAGSYVAVIMGMPKYGESSQKKAPFVEFTVKFFEAMQDVNEDELEEYGSIADLQMPMTFYYASEGGYRRLMDFLDNCEIEADGKTDRQRIEEASGKTIIVNVKHSPQRDGTLRAQIDGTAKYGE